MKKVALLGAVAVILGACQTTSVQENAATNVSLEPAERVLLEPGTESKVKRLRNGVEQTSTASLESPGVYKWAVSNGCHGTSVAGDRFAPTLSWNKCGTNANWHTGKTTIKSKNGEIWPLKVGSKVSYSYSTLSHTGRTSDNQRDCEVTSIVNVVAAGKSYDTYKVMCNDRFNRDTFYYSPSEAAVVLQEHYEKNRNVTEVTEFVARIS